MIKHGSKSNNPKYTYTRRSKQKNKRTEIQKKGQKKEDQKKKEAKQRK
eukprot:GDKH01001104.1.p3 GENE.GDKH01001104.1~~GDKH01001104.1.p3  ORF type:complete len:58 (-),score=8.98 GDKH01001104.1:87-230(-)